jgi:hypothetical protein
MSRQAKSPSRSTTRAASAPRAATKRPAAAAARPATARPAAVTALVAVLILQAAGGLGGGAALIASPKGGIIRMPLSDLAGSPFHDFLIPGIILFAVLGLGPLLAAWALLREPRIALFEALNPFRRQYWAWTAAGVVGVGLLIWIAVEVAIIPFSILQPFYAAVGLVIVALTLRREVRDYYRR